MTPPSGCTRRPRLRSLPGLLRGLAVLVLGVGWAPGRLDAQMLDPGLGPPVPRLHLLPTTEFLRPGELAGSVGQTSTFGGGLYDGGGGSGNQTYLAMLDLGLPGPVLLQGWVETNDDPTYGPVLGRPRAKEFFAAGGALRVLLGRAGPFRVAVEAAGAGLGVKSEAGLFDTDSTFTRRYLPVGSVAGIVGLSLGDRWALTLVPSWAWLPEEHQGLPFYGPTWRVGAGLRGDLHRAFRVFATGELPLGPGGGTVDRDRIIGRRPLWSTGVTFVSSPRVQLLAYLTNQAGGGPPTRHLTLMGEHPVQWGARLRYTLFRPSGSRSARGRPSLDQPAGDVAGSFQGKQTRSLLIRLVLAEELDLELGLTHAPDLGAQEALGIDLDQGTHFRLGATLTLLDQRLGMPLTVAGRVTVGQDVQSRSGFLLAELPLSRRFHPWASLSLTPVATLHGGERPLGVALGAELGPDGGLQLVGEGMVLRDPLPALWRAGIALPWVGPARAEVFATTARSTLGMGRLLGDPDETWWGVTLRVRLP